MQATEPATDLAASPPRRGCVFYDAECQFCAAGVRRWGGLFARRGFAWVPLQTAGVANRLGIAEAELLIEMKLLRTGGEVVGGIDACAVLMRSVWWLWPFGALLALPGVRAFGGASYRWLARHRHWFGCGCAWANGGGHRRRPIAFLEFP